VDGLKPGDAAALLVESADGSEKTLEPIFVVPEQDQRLTIRLYPPCRAQGQVLDAVGQPVAGAMVRLSVLRWLGEADAGATAHTDEAGGFEFHSLIPGAYYTVSAHAGPGETPPATWRSRPFVVRGWDGVGHLEPLFPEGRETAPPRPDGVLLQRLLSGREDEWFDAELRAWLPAVETFDPNRVWGEPPEESVWVWRAGRPDPVSEKLGAVVEFRRQFILDPACRKPVGYLTILTDDYGLVRFNGEWVGVAAGYRQPVNLLIDPEHLRMGKNVLQVTLHNAPGVGRDEYNPTGFAYCLELMDTDQ
jgi:hypothetical protein